MFNKILIANRGEIACRIIKTVHALGIKSVAVYSSADKEANFVKMAHEAYHIGEPPANKSYLNIEKIISVALKAKADAIHPGYGFLAENADFAKACFENNIVFIGPRAKAITLMGDKAQAKETIAKHNLPVIPGYQGEKQSNAVLVAKAKEIGLPLLIKPAKGGGGKGMRLVSDFNTLVEDIESAKREAKSSFADDSLILEKAIIEPRHIEVQILADNFGNYRHFYERDCSIQRRHQKIIEEAPAFNIEAELQTKICETAIECARTIDYVGAGTIEFLLDKNNNFYFMEMNTRLQVEHPVTEMITNVDLVEQQIRIAADEAIAIQQKDITIKGHAIEARVYAEDPLNNFIPQTGKIAFMSDATGEPHCRIDTGVSQDSQISIYYDPMIAKVIAWGETRDKAIYNLNNILAKYIILGVNTNRDYLRKIINFEKFKDGNITTAFIKDCTNDLNLQRQVVTNEVLVIATLYLALSRINQNTKPNLLPWQTLPNFRLNISHQEKVEFYEPFTENFIPTQYFVNANTIDITIDKETYSVQGELEDNKLKVYINSHIYNCLVAKYDNKIFVIKDGEVFELHEKVYEHQTTAHANENSLTAPMHGTITAILASPGKAVKAGEKLVIMEAMKMEHSIYAPKIGVIKDVFYKEGDLVEAGVSIISMDN